MQTAITTAGLKVLGETTSRQKPTLTDAIYGRLKRARETRKEMLALPRGPMKEQIKQRMYEEYHTFYIELRRHRRHTNEE